MVSVRYRWSQAEKIKVERAFVVEVLCWGVREGGEHVWSMGREFGRVKCWWLPEDILLGSWCEVVEDGLRSFGVSILDLYSEKILARYVSKPGPKICRYTCRKVPGSVPQYKLCARNSVFFEMYGRVQEGKI